MGDQLLEAAGVPYIPRRPFPQPGVPSGRKEGYLREVVLPLHSLTITGRISGRHVSSGDQLVGI